MGNATSQTELDAIKVESPKQPLSVFDKRFCMPTATYLRVKDNVGLYAKQKTYIVRDSNTNTSFFHLDAQTGPAAVSGDKVTVKTLSDVYNKQVWGMSPDDKSVSNFVTFKAKNGEHAYNLVSQTGKEVPELRLLFKDQNGVGCEASIKGDLHGRKCAIWVDIGRQGKGNRIVIAKIHDEDKPSLPNSASTSPCHSPQASSPPSTIITAQPVTYVPNRLLVNRITSNRSLHGASSNPSIFNKSGNSLPTSPPKSYIIEIAPHVDLAFVVNLAIALDDYQRYHSTKSSN
jgi:hypothetical protein